VAGTSIEKAPAGDVPESIHGQGPTEQVGAEVQQAAHGEVVRYNPDAPSEEWGWHGSFREFAPIGSRILLWVAVVVMFIMIFAGNQESNVENYWLAAIGILMAVWLLRTDARIRRERRRRP
jgi:general stress protein CsbA